MLGFKCATFCLLLIVCDALAAAAKCGKLSHKASYRKKKTLESPKVIGETCRYRIRAPNGLHVKFSANSVDIGNLANFTVYDASKKPFKWRNDQILMEMTGSDLERSEINLGKSIIGVEYEGTSLTPQIRFDYSATIPSDNNFGFDSIASTRERVIRTPGFPRASLGSGIRCTWNLRSKRSKNAILLVVQGLRTSSDRDYIEVYDGDRVVGKISRRLNKLEPKPEFVALSGRMKVYLHTETPGSKGFKATYKTIKVNHTVIAEPDLDASGGLLCHNRNRVMAQGGTVRDIHYSTSCSLHEVCGRMLSESQNNVVGGVKMTNELMSCIPKAMCINTKCQKMPPPPEGTELLSCNLSCCSTNMCNRSPDGPDVPPTTEEEASRITPSLYGPPGLECLVRSEIKMGKKTLGDASADNVCNPGEICALYVFQGTAIDFDGTRRPGSGYAAKCELESDCTQEGCHNIKQSRYIEMASCEVKCCKTTKCNRPPGYETVLSPLPTAGAVTECYDILSTKTGGRLVMDKAEVTRCSIPDSRCSKIHMRATALTEGGGEILAEMAYGACVPSAICDSLNCDVFKSSMTGITVQACEATCCDTNLCNKKDSDTVSTPKKRIECDQQSQISIGEHNVGSASGGNSCGQGEICALYVYEGTSLETGIEIKGNGYSAQCEAESQCNQDGCRGVYESRYINITSCDVKCCKTRGCNNPPENWKPLYPPPIGTTECYNIMSTTADGVSVINNRDVTKCPLPDSKCSRIDVVATDTGGNKRVVSEYGQCVPAAACRTLDCSDLENMPGFTVQSCKASCCETNLCNAFPSDHIQPMPELPPMVVSGGVGQPRITCYEMTDVKASGVSLPVTEEKKKKLCDPGFQCMKMTAVASFNRYSTMTVTTVVGSCQPSFMCTSIDCSSMASPLPDVTIKSCDASCCDTDLCNG